MLVGLVFLARGSHAQTPDELQAARQLFSDAVLDEEKGKHAVALEKYRRVQAVRDTATVRYRIGACLESMGRLREAAVEYDAAAAKAEPGQREVATSATQKAAAARQRMPELVVDVEEKDATVRLDDQVLGASRVGVPQKVNPGKHVIDADAPGLPHFRAELEVRESSRARLRVSFAKGAAVAPGSSSATDTSSPPGARDDEGSTQRTAGWVTLAAGVTVGLTGIGFLIAREGEISSINESCPAGVCPASLRDTITGQQSRARTFGPLGFTFVAGGIAAAGVGAYLLLTLPKSRASSSLVFPTVLPGGAGATWVGHF
ncbi:MAG: hypothetical protein U0174_00930 [Polyangiaceae bacterium]